MSTAPAGPAANGAIEPASSGRLNSPSYGDGALERHAAASAIHLEPAARSDRRCASHVRSAAPGSSSRMPSVTSSSPSRSQGPFPFAAPQPASPSRVRFARSTVTSPSMTPFGSGKRTTFWTGEASRAHEMADIAQIQPAAKGAESSRIPAYAQEARPHFDYRAAERLRPCLPRPRLRPGSILHPAVEIQVGSDRYRRGGGR